MVLQVRIPVEHALDPCFGFSFVENQCCIGILIVDLVQVVVLRKKDSSFELCRFQLGQEGPVIQHFPVLGLRRVPRTIDLRVHVIVPTILKDGLLSNHVSKHARAHELVKACVAWVLLIFAAIPMLGLEAVAMKEGKYCAGSSLWKPHIDDWFRQQELFWGREFGDQGWILLAILLALNGFGVVSFV